MSTTHPCPWCGQELKERDLFHAHDADLCPSCKGAVRMQYRSATPQDYQWVKDGPLERSPA